MGKAGAQPCHCHLENRWTEAPTTPAIEWEGSRLTQGPYYHFLGSEEISQLALNL